VSSTDRPSQGPGGSFGGGTPDDRYGLNGTLGRGGMAIVYDATEIATGRRVALKRLQTLSDARKQQRNVELFEREFRTLAQLSHPRIVEVYDYGLDSEGAFYTMELLEGGDMQQLSPMPWGEACEIARDLCSALSLVHSRRLVHRDVSPRNVRRAANGSAKLIDFGAMAPVGSSKIIVGTPPCCAPESVCLQPLDGRTDLFALGATLYFMLTGRHAYAARHFSLLNDAWQAGFPRPLELTPELPAALDALVLELLRLEPDARPPNAAEVSERLSALLGSEPSEDLRVAQAYLVMPALVGREEPLAKVRRRLEHKRRGRTVLIEGASGVGRSRFLDACILDATLLGAAVLRADALDARSGDYGVLRALARQLLTIMPSAAAEAAQPELALLSQVLPELREAAPPSAADGPAPNTSRPQLQAALQRWLAVLARRGGLILAVDDFHRCDEPSAALLSLLVHEPIATLHLLLSCERSATWSSSSARRIVQQEASRVTLENLTREQSDALLRSLFGEVPNAESFAQRLHEIAGGKPRDLLRLAQHLVDRRVIRYEGAAWSLATHVDGADLPSSMAGALRARIEALDPSARELASAFALCLDETFGFEECDRMRAQPDPRELQADLDTLAAAEIVRSADDRYSLTHAMWAPALGAALPPTAAKILEARLARIFEVRGQDFRAGRHWLRADETERGLNTLVAHARTSQEQTAQRADLFLRYARSLPADWLETFELALRTCEELQRPRRDAMMLRGRLAGILPAFGLTDRAHLATLIEQLCQDCGFYDLDTVDPALPALERCQRAVQVARERQAVTPEQERGLDPAIALAMLARTINATSGSVTVALDVPFLRSMPDLTPLAPISPALAFISRLHKGMDARYSGRIESARAIYRALLERTHRPDNAGLEGSYLATTRLNMSYALGVMDACMGLESSLAWAEDAANAANQLNAFQIRKLYQLYQGNAREAEHCRVQCEKLRLQNFQLYEAPSHVVWELGAYSIAEDLTQLRYALEQIAPLAARHEAWRAVQEHSHAEYHRIRGDRGQALAAAERALHLVQPGAHPIWTEMASTHVRALDDLGRHEESLRAAEAYAQRAERAELGYGAQQLELLRGYCRARGGVPGAAPCADAAIEELKRQGVTGLWLGLAYELRARVALYLGDDAGFLQFGEACREVYCKNGSPALLAKYRRLRQDGTRRQPVITPDARYAPDSEVQTGLRLVAALEHCTNDDQRCKFALTILVRQAGAQAGFLFTYSDDRVQLGAGVGDLSLPRELQARAQTYLGAHTQVGQSTLSDSESVSQVDDLIWHDERGNVYRPVLLSHNSADNLVVMGVALLALSDSAPFRYPAQVAAAISRFWAEHGHTSMVVVSECGD
jgi:hypothetical protein